MADETILRFSTKLRELSTSRSEKLTLMEIKSLVMDKEKQVLIQIGEKYSLDPIFNCLNSSDQEQIEISCCIIYNILKNMNPKNCLSNYNKLLERSLSHPSPEIKITILKLLNDIIAGDDINRIYKEYAGLLIQASECIGNPERGVAQGAITLFTSMGSNEDGLRVLYSSMLLEKFREVMMVNDIARFRVYEIASQVSQKSEEGLKASQTSGLLNLLISEVKSSDTLLQLNALEILSSLGTSRHGYKYLQDSGVIEYLSDKIIKLDDESLSFVLLPGLIEFFGNICEANPQDCLNVHPEVINFFFKSLQTEDEVVLGVIYSTVGKIGASNNGKEVLNSQQSNMQFFFKRAGEIISQKNDTSVSVLHSLTSLFTVENGPQGFMNDVLLLWFENMGPDALDIIVSITRLPFIGLRLSALTLLNAIAKQPWGADKLCHYAGMIEYLMDRSTEFHKDCKSAKYDIVCSLSDSPNIRSILNEEVLTQLIKFVKEGPFYVPTSSPELMTEGAS